MQVVGQGGGILQVDNSFRALRASLRPVDHSTLGHYSVFEMTGAIAATLAADATLFSMRWGDATRLFMLTKLEVNAVIASAITAAVPFGVEAFVARSFSASDSAQTQLT